MMSLTELPKASLTGESPSISSIAFIHFGISALVGSFESSALISRENVHFGEVHLADVAIFILNLFHDFSGTGRGSSSQLINKYGRIRSKVLQLPPLSLNNIFLLNHFELSYTFTNCEIFNDLLLGHLLFGLLLCSLGFKFEDTLSIFDLGDLLASSKTGKNMMVSCNLVLLLRDCCPRTFS